MALQMNTTKLYENTRYKKRPSKDTKIQKYTCTSLQCVSRQRAGYVDTNENYNTIQKYTCTSLQRAGYADTNDIYKTIQKYKIQETP